MQTLGKYSMNLLAGRDVKKTLVIVIKGLTEDFIIGMNLIGWQKLHWNPKSNDFGWGDIPTWYRGHCRCKEVVKLDALSVTRINVNLIA